MINANVLTRLHTQVYGQAPSDWQKDFYTQWPRHQGAYGRIEGEVFQALMLCAFALALPWGKDYCDVGLVTANGVPIVEWLTMEARKMLVCQPHKANTISEALRHVMVRSTFPTDLSSPWIAVGVTPTDATTPAACASKLLHV